MFNIILFAILSSLCLSHRDHQIEFTFVTALFKPTSPIHTSLSYEQQLSLLDQLLKTQENVIIFGEEQLMKHVMKSRSKNNTVFVVMSLDELQKTPSAVQVANFMNKARSKNPALFDRYQNYPQFASSEYASIMFSKPFLLNKALSYDIFNSDYIYWIEPDILSRQEYTQRGLDFFSRKRNMLRKFSMHFQLPFIVRSGNKSNLDEGFKNNGEHYGRITTFSSAEWFGGRVQSISTVSALYDDLLSVTLGNGDFWSHESIFTLMIHRYPKIVTEVNNLHPGGMYYFDINGFIERPIKQVRFSSVYQGENSTLKFYAIGQRPIPIYTTTIKTYENFYEYELLMKSFKLRADRERLFLLCLVFVYVVVKVLKNLEENKNRGTVIKDEKINE